MTPKEYKQMMDYLTRSGIRKQVKFASDIARPDPKPEIKEIEAINAFMRRNPINKADGGRVPFLFAGSATAKKQAKEKEQKLKKFVTEFKAKKGDVPRLIDISKALKVSDTTTKKYLTEGDDYKVTVKPGINAPKTGKKKYVKMTPEEKAEAYRLRDEGGAANTLARNKEAKETIDSFIEKGDYENFKTKIYESQMKKEIRPGKFRRTTGGRVPPTILNFIRDRLDAGPGTELFEELKEITGRTEKELLDFKNNIPKKGFQPTKTRSKTAIETSGRRKTDEEKRTTKQRQKAKRAEAEAVGTKYASEQELQNFQKIKKEIANKNKLFASNPDLINSPQYAKIKEMMEVRIAPNDLTLPSGKEVKAGEIYRREVDSKGKPLTDEYYRNKAKSGKLFSFFDINRVGTQMGKFASNANITPGDFNSAFIQGQVEKFFTNYDPQTKKPGKFYGDTEKLKNVDEYLKSVGVKVKISGMKNRIGGGDPVFFDSKTGDFPHIRNTLNTMGFKNEDINLKPTTNVIPKKTGTEGFVDRQLLTDAGKFLGRAAQAGFLTPTGVAATTLGLGGLDLTSPVGRLSLGAELAAAPELVKASIGATRGMKNRALQKGIQQVLNLGLPTRLALRAARIASPIGIATLAGEGLYQAGKFSRDRIRELQAMTPEQRQQLRAEQSALAFEGARDGGLIGKKSGPPPISGPTPHGDEGLPGIFKRVKKG